MLRGHSLGKCFKDVRGMGRVPGLAGDCVGSLTELTTRPGERSGAKETSESSSEVSLEVRLGFNNFTGGTTLFEKFYINSNYINKHS